MSNRPLTPHTQILRLARSGSPERAWSLMSQHGLLDSDTDPKALTLQARLVKDRAKRARAREERTRLFAESAGLYAKAAALDPASYPLINAASLSLFAGKRAEAEELARQALGLIEGDPEEGETPYWHEATRAEALLLLGQEPEARASLNMAVAIQPEAWEDHAATIGQFGLILAEQGRDAGWLDDHRPPVSVHFSGLSGLSPDDHVVAVAFRDFIAQERPAFAYGALAAGADLLFAQAFLEHRDVHCPSAELHVILPFPVDQFREMSVAAFGGHWLPLFDATLDQADSLSVLGLDDPPLGLAVEISEQVAMGRAVRNAQILQSEAVGVTVIAAGEALRPQLAAWRDAGQRLDLIEGNRQAEVSASFAPEVTQKRLATLVWASGADPSLLGPGVDDGGHWHSGAHGHWRVCEDAKGAALEATKLALSSETARVSVLHAIFDPRDRMPRVLERAEALAEVSSPRTVATDHCGAMTLVLQGWRGSIDEIGEVQTAWGSEAVWSVT